MTKNHRWLKVAILAAASLATTSCYYDPYYTGASSGGGYYGGNSGGRVNATFVFTSDSRWLYDPEVFCYYDRHRRCYYDPYLYGYYPVGYCPRPIYGAYHPGGWRPGARSCPPPVGFRDRFLPNYQNRVDRLRSANYTWAAKVRERNDATAEAWRNQRVRAASHYHATHNTRNDRNHHMREPQSERHQTIFDRLQPRHESSFQNPQVASHQEADPPRSRLDEVHGNPTRTSSGPVENPQADAGFQRQHRGQIPQQQEQVPQQQEQVPQQQEQVPQQQEQVPQQQEQEQVPQQQHDQVYQQGEQTAQ